MIQYTKHMYVMSVLRKDLFSQIRNLKETTEKVWEINESMKDCCSDNDWSGCYECQLWAYSADFEWGQTDQFICDECIDLYDLTRCDDCDDWPDRYGRCDCSNK